MGKIRVLEKRTVDQIAAGEVVERPMSVVKELMENAIDAGATSVSVETKNGGIDYIRVTDDGCGIDPSDILTAFQAHATSKIREIEDLDQVMSLGFRGEALSSIASVSKVELITKTAEEISGSDVNLVAGDVVSEEQIGVPCGTTMIVSDLFFNVPARRKFLKTPATENAAVGDFIEKVALSHPNIRFKWVSNGKIRLATYGNGKVKDLIFAIFGKETAEETLEISYQEGDIKITGFLGKPIIAKGNKSFENYFINGRFVKSKIIDAAIEAAYAPFMMQHRFPFVLLYIEMPPTLYDVNVHPTKMELRFSKEQEVYDIVFKAVMNGLTHKEMIPDAAKESEKPTQQQVYSAPEPFEKKRIQESETPTKQENSVNDTSRKVSETPANQCATESQSNQRATEFTSNQDATESQSNHRVTETSTNQRATEMSKNQSQGETSTNPHIAETPDYRVSSLRKMNFGEEERKSCDTDLFENLKGSGNSENSNQSKVVTQTEEPIKSEGAVQPEKTSGHKVPSGTTSQPHPDDELYAKKATQETFLSNVEKKNFRLIGQLFKTYWLIEMDDTFYILDQHAAHEKVLYERKMKAFSEKKISTQTMNPPYVFRVSEKEELLINRFTDAFSEFGFELRYFGDKEYALTGVPQDLFGLPWTEVFKDILSELSTEYGALKSETVLAKLASMSCKAAVKAHDFMTEEEAKALLSELLTLENPYACPHGRPTVISMSRSDIEKKFKRIV